MFTFLRRALCLCAAIAFMQSNAFARTYFMPDYQRNLVGRVNDGGKDDNCGNMFANCPKNMSGRTVKHPIAGLTCYEECVCDETYYKYSSSNCASPKILGGETCSDLSSKASEQTPSTEYYSECNCPAEYNLSTCPINANCESCGNKYKLVNCKDGYTNQNGTCVKVENCSAYPLTVCPTGGTCSNCPDNSAKKKLDSCDTAKGWKQSGNTCVAIACPTGYSAGVETCTSGNTKPDYAQSGMSGGKPCGLCKCNNIDTTCTAANYPVNSVPANATKTSECSTGCGSEKVTRYKFECNNGYKLSGNACVANDDTCPTGYTKTACSLSQKQTGRISNEAGTICYQCEDIDENDVYQVCIDSNGNLSNSRAGSECCMDVAASYCDDADAMRPDDILYTDGSTCRNLVLDKTPLAIVLDDDNWFAVGIHSLTRTNSNYWSKAVQLNAAHAFTETNYYTCAEVKTLAERNDSYGCSLNNPTMTVYAYGPRTTQCALKRGAKDEAGEEDQIQQVNIFQEALSRTRMINSEYLGCATTKGQMGLDILDRKGIWYVPTSSEMYALDMKKENCRIRLMQKLSENAAVTEEFYYGDNVNYWLSYAALGNFPCAFKSGRTGNTSTNGPVGDSTGQISSSSQMQAILFIDPREYAELAKDPDRCDRNEMCAEFAQKQGKTLVTSTEEMTAALNAGKREIYVLGNVQLESGATTAIYSGTVNIYNASSINVSCVNSRTSVSGSFYPKRADWNFHLPVNFGSVITDETPSVSFAAGGSFIDFDINNTIGSNTGTTINFSGTYSYTIGQFSVSEPGEAGVTVNCSTPSIDAYKTLQPVCEQGAMTFGNRLRCNNCW